MSNEDFEACDCLLCTRARAARAASGADAGPREPADDDSDDESDDDDDESEAAAAPSSDGLCECPQCRPKPIPSGEALREMLVQISDSFIKNYDEAGDYGARVTNGLAAMPLPAEVEAILLQYAVDNWNAADRAAIAICSVIAKHDAEAKAHLPKSEQKTLDDALTTLAATRADRPRRRGHNLASRVQDVAERILGTRVDVRVMKL